MRPPSQAHLQAALRLRAEFSSQWFTTREAGFVILENPILDWMNGGSRRKKFLHKALQRLRTLERHKLVVSMPYTRPDGRTTQHFQVEDAVLRHWARYWHRRHKHQTDEAGFLDAL